MSGSNCETRRWICDDLTAISSYFAGPIITLSGRIDTSEYVNIIGNQVDPMVQMFFHFNDAVFQDDNSSIHTARSVQSCFDKHEDALNTFPGQHNHQT